MHDAYTPLVFFHHSLHLRALMVDNQPWFVAHDFARLIGHPDAQPLLAALAPHEQQTLCLEYTRGFHEEVATPCRSLLSFASRQLGVVRWQSEVWVAWRDLPTLMTSGKEVSA